MFVFHMPTLRKIIYLYQFLLDIFTILHHSDSKVAKEPIEEWV